jgi:hypothetical protein
VRGHEVDFIRRAQLGRKREIALVLAVFVVYYDDDFAAAVVGDYLFYFFEISQKLSLSKYKKIKIQNHLRGEVSPSLRPAAMRLFSATPSAGVSPPQRPQP